MRVVELTKSFGGYTAVNGVNFTVADGEVRAIIGPNGAGKTTLFHLLSGHLKPTRGQVLLDGVEIGGRAPHHIARRGVSRAFQTTNIFPSFTVFDNVLVSVLAHHRRQFHFWGRRDAEMVKRVLNILEMVHLADAKDQLASTLAHGDQRALEVAIALGSEPRVLLLDEPTAGMSPYETQEMIRLLQHVIADRGLTVILSEHDMDVVFGLAHRITVIEAGSVLAEGTPEEIRNNPDVIRAYLGEAQ
ncbi:ABC transporter ATP-binding protein [Alicyclobacillus cycloheptanicus]|nr:ABC transporter ATP-binding protein [Alicyclobacillus cycloheptanicus]